MTSRQRAALVALVALALMLIGVGCGSKDHSKSGGQASSAQVRQYPADTSMGRIQRKGEIVIGVKYDVPPFGFRNPRSGRVEGFDVDFGNAVAQALGVRPKLIEAVSDNRIPFIKDGTVDLVLSTMTINRERARQVGFTNPYFLAHGRVLVPQNSNIRGVKDLAGRRVCTALGSTYERTLKQQAPRAQLRLVDAYSECLELLQNRAVDAISTDDVILTGMIIQDRSLKLVGGNLTTEPYGGGFRRGDRAFRGFLNGVLRDYEADGRWQRSYDRWLGRFTGQRQRPPTETLEQALRQAG